MKMVFLMTISKVTNKVSCASVEPVGDELMNILHHIDRNSSVGRGDGEKSGEESNDSPDLTGQRAQYAVKMLRHVLSAMPESSCKP